MEFLRGVRQDLALGCASERLAVFGMVRFDGIDQSDRAALKDIKRDDAQSLCVTCYCVTPALVDFFHVHLCIFYTT